MAASNTDTKLRQDKDSTPIQVLAPVETSVQGFTLSGSTQTTALPTSSEIVEVAITGNCKFAFGTAAVNATSGTKRVLTAGVYVYAVPETSPGTIATHFDAVTVDGSSGRVTVARMT